MEAAGTGFDKIVEDYKDADEKHRPFISSASDHFTLVLPDLTYVDGIEESAIPTIEFAPVQKAQILTRRCCHFATIAHIRFQR